MIREGSEWIGFFFVLYSIEMRDNAILRGSKAVILLVFLYTNFRAVISFPHCFLGKYQRALSLILTLFRLCKHEHRISERAEGEKQIFHSMRECKNRDESFNHATRRLSLDWVQL